ncbi:MAG TPA: glucose-1-phosphate thymidylyltransferase, partial [Anaerolineae bacterium]|nr:glucose-1-phosphate thymidylyltransferase [Anaerolineae bacterium]
AGQRIIEGDVMTGAIIDDGPIYIGKGAVIHPTAWIQSPAYIAAGAVVRHGALVRPNVIMLEGSVIGHASEAKNAILLKHAYAPHFAYVGDSILGNHCNLGAGTKLSNLSVLSEKDIKTGKRPTIKLIVDKQQFDTGLAKMGAILGDHAQTGCNTVLNPGCIIGKHSLVYANTSLRKGVYPANSLIKLRQVMEIVTRR